MTNTKLNSSAKAFVPQSLKPSAGPSKPTASESETTERPKDSPVSNSTNGNDTEKKSAAPVEAKKQPTAEVTSAPAPAPAVSAWGKKKSNAIRAAPSAKQTEQQHQHIQRSNSNNNKGSKDKGGWRKSGKDNKGQEGGGSGNWRSGGGGRNNNNKQRQQSGGTRGGDRSGGDGGEGDKNEGWKRGNVPVEFCKPGEGATEAQKKVRRIRVTELLALRLSYVAKPLAWDNEDNQPPEICQWTSDTRLQEINDAVKSPRLGGDVSQKRKKHDTAPALEDCKPLEVNNDTRWKSKVFSGEKGDVEDAEVSDKELLKKSLLILNKLSLTKFKKLSDKFIETGIGRNEKCLAGAIELIVNKAQDEPHFSAMYAALCLKLSQTPMSFEQGTKKGKKFKKMLLLECQKEFEQETEAKIEAAIKDIEDEEEKSYKAGIIKKHYLGHMTFIGELYKGDLISIKIMLLCLPALLEATSEGGTAVDEEKVECFAKLMSTIGSSLEYQSEGLKNNGKPETSASLEACWNKVEVMAGKKKGKDVKVSNRIKFMLQDLIEMKENGWTKRREEETAKTIDQIHKEAAKDARRSASSNSLTGMRRQSSANDVRSIARSGSKPNVDADGFTEVSKPGSNRGMGRSQSMGYMTRRPSDQRLSSRNKPDAPKRSTSTGGGGSFSAFNKSDSKSSQKREAKVEKKEVVAPVKKIEYLDAGACGDKAKGILKEYFIGGDLDDAVLSFKELIGAGADGSIDRGAKAVEGSIMMVLEMKKEDVSKFLTVINQSYKEKDIESASIVSSLNDPLEFLTDIAIDAPLATSHLVQIICEFLKMGAISFDFFLNTPEYFRTDCGAAGFCCKVLNALGGDALESSSNIEVIEKIMTDDDRESFPTVKDLLDA